MDTGMMLNVGLQAGVWAAEPYEILWEQVVREADEMYLLQDLKCVYGNNAREDRTRV